MYFWLKIRYSVYFFVITIPMAIFYFSRGQENISVKAGKAQMKQVEVVDKDSSEVDLDWIPEHLRKEKPKNKK